MEELLKMLNEVLAQVEGTENKIEKVYNLGLQAGIQLMMDKIERQYELGKPILANGNLYWMKDAKQNLIDIMDDLEADAE